MSTRLAGIPSMNRIGFFGKMPRYGDFVQHNLPSDFVSPWDQWLQQVIYQGQEILANSWLDCWLQAPIWRFTVSPGVIGPQAWIGILIPSVDKVGRYFPLTVAMPLPGNISPIDAFFQSDEWFLALEDAGAAALDPACDTTHLAAACGQMGPLSVVPEEVSHSASSSLSDIPPAANWTIGDGGWQERAVKASARYALLRRPQSYSFWGALDANDEGWVCLHTGLPDADAFSAMLAHPMDGRLITR